MSKLSVTFESLYNASKEALDLMKKPFVLNKNKRAIQAAIDSAEVQKLEAEEEIEKLLLVIQKGEVIDFNKLLSFRQTIKNADATIVALKEFEKEFFN